MATTDRAAHTVSEQHNDTGELDRGPGIDFWSVDDDHQRIDWSSGSALWVSGSGVWPATADGTTSGGDHTEPDDPLVDGRGGSRVPWVRGRVDGSDLDPNPLLSPLLRAFFTADTDTTWNDIQALPRLSEAPLGAHELRRDGIGATIEPPPDRGTRPDLGHTIDTRRRLDRARWNIVAAARIALAAVSIAILVLGLGLLTWALLSPADGESTEPPELIATSGPAGTI